MNKNKSIQTKEELLKLYKEHKPSHLQMEEVAGEKMGISSDLHGSSGNYFNLHVGLSGCGQQKADQQTSMKLGLKVTDSVSYLQHPDALASTAQRRNYAMAG